MVDTLLARTNVSGMNIKTIQEVAAMGGRARADKLTKTRRIAIAKHASKQAQKARKQKAIDLAGKVV
jgi:hypothetical protein